MIVRSRGGAMQLRDTGSSLAALTGYAANFDSLDISSLTAGMTVTPNTARAVPAVTQVIRQGAEQVARLQLTTYAGDDITPEKRANTWQAKLFGRPNEVQTAFEFCATIQESVDFRGNGFIWKLKDPRTGRPLALYALHPDQIRAFYPRLTDTAASIKFYVGVMPGFIDPVGRGFGFYEVDLDTIVIVRGFGAGGQILAPNPVELHRQQFGISLAKMNHEASMYAKGTASRVAISFPQGMQKKQADEWREAWQDAYAGPGNAGKTPAVGGGATIVPIGMSMADAEYIASVGMDVLQVARIFNWLPSLLGGGLVGRTSDTPLTPEHEKERLLTYALEPRLTRFEQALALDLDLFPIGTRYRPQFETNRFVRGDLATEAQIALGKVQSGQWTVNYARALDGLPPIEGGDVIQQTPVGGAPNPGAPPAVDVKQ